MSKITCKIDAKCDFLTGMYLTTRIPDADVDENALLTIQEDCPEFILPFNYRNVNGQTEFTFKVGNLSKLQYFYGEIPYAEYVALWKSLLSPLLECTDWFMSPDCFVLDTDYLYYDKNKNMITYVYVPNLNGCSGYDSFNEMAIEVAKSIKVSDPVLENKVLRSIINDFNPGDFLKMLLDYTNQKEPVITMYQSMADDAAQTDDVQVSAAQNSSDVFEKKSQSMGGFRMFRRSGKRKNETKRNGFKNILPGNIPPASPPKFADVVSITQETKSLISGTGLRYIGRMEFPQMIEVDISDGDIFTIGRHDVNAGKKQSNFEFDAKTKAISRRHAAIERDGEIYRIVDLSSSAGTFVNDKKLPPNTPAVLKTDYRVSFGNLGADYVWNIS